MCMHGSRTFSEGVGVREIIVIAGDGVRGIFLLNSDIDIKINNFGYENPLKKYTRTELSDHLVAFFHIQMRYNNHTVDHSISQFCICRYSHEWWLEKGWLCWAHLEPSRRSQTSCLSSPIRIDPQFQCHFH